MLVNIRLFVDKFYCGRDLCSLCFHLETNIIWFQIITQLNIFLLTLLGHHVGRKITVQYICVQKLNARAQVQQLPK